MDSGFLGDSSSQGEFWIYFLQVDLTRRSKGCTQEWQNFAGILMFEETRRHLFAFSLQSFSSDVNTYFGLVWGGKLDPSPLRIEAPELKEEKKIYKACQQTDTPYIALLISLIFIKHISWRPALYPSAASLNIIQIPPLS